ncbi:MAG TPA: radical SAM protein [Anaerolineae bacterium]|nr:radical SAM protein [Anaerolineae bacterium]
MIHEVTAKTLLSSAKRPDPWFGIKYTMNLYRGCQHQCIYCDSRSECYQIENFADVLVKVNAIALLKKELPRKRVKGTIGTGSMSDPYLPLEATRRLTAQALEVIAEQQFPLHALTKSDLVVRDLDTLRHIARVYAAVSFTITTADDELGKKVEPGAPLVSRRFAALSKLAEAGLLTGVLMMPVLPFIEDNAENITAIVTRAKDCGATYILAAFGMTLRDRQRAYYYAQLDRLFPGLRRQYEQQFGPRYSASAQAASRLEQIFREACAQHGIATRMPFYEPAPPLQPALF